MKIRIHRNVLRLRLSQAEVELFGKNGQVVDSINFGVGAMKYQLLSIADNTDILSRFEENCITIEVPSQHATEWVQTDQVSLENANQESLKILVEKDFKCLHKRTSDEYADSFPNPMADN